MCMKYKFQNIVCSRKGCRDLEYGYVLVLDNDLSVLDYALNGCQIDIEHAVLDKIYNKHSTNALSFASTTISEITGESFVNTLSNITGKRIAGMLKTQRLFGTIYLQKSGGYFYSDDVKVLDEIITDKFIFPIKKSLTKNDIKVKRWTNGTHYYVYIDGNQLEVDGVRKWRNVKYAEELAEAEIEKINRGSA